jgi:very-long-chain enoyl-CoA reductase
MYWFLKPDEVAPKTRNIILASIFTIFEILNLKTHLILKNLRKEGTTDRGIPFGWGFNQVSCANYLWEACAWSSFAVVSNVWGSWLFLVVSFIQMLIWAIKKHKRYQKEFNDYPKSRKAMIPYLI